jgi:hypothetical protein
MLARLANIHQEFNYLPLMLTGKLPAINSTRITHVTTLNPRQPRADLDL